ncbi:MAG: hypothetical protein HOI95_20860 [Chromatiales bacterium]|nr:hypothetical protein [Chromatiales bacterium]
MALIDRTSQYFYLPESRRLRLAAGDIQDAQRQLKGLYESFTEGHEFADLQDAEGLLQELASRA